MENTEKAEMTKTKSVDSNDLIDQDSFVTHTKPAVKTKPKPKVEKIKDPAEIAVVAEFPVIEKMSEIDEYIYRKMFEIVKNAPYAADAAALSRLSLMGNVSKLLADNAKLSGALTNLLETFEVSVSVTMASDDGSVHSYSKFVKSGETHTTDFLIQGLASLIARFNSLSRDKSAVENLLTNEQQTTANLTAENRRLLNKIATLESTPPLPRIIKPFVLAKPVVIKGKPNFSYIKKDEKLGYASVTKLAEAMRLNSDEEAAEVLIEICDNQSDYAIKKPYDYKITTLHYNLYATTSMPPTTQLALAQAIDRATLNDK